MRELSKVVLFSAIGTIVSLFIIIVFLIKKKEHKDFKAVVFAFSIFTLICLYLSITGLVDILNVKNG